LDNLIERTVDTMKPHQKDYRQTLVRERKVEEEKLKKSKQTRRANRDLPTIHGLTSALSQFFTHNFEYSDDSESDSDFDHHSDSSDDHWSDDDSDINVIGISFGPDRSPITLDSSSSSSDSSISSDSSVSSQSESLNMENSTIEAPDSLISMSPEYDHESDQESFRSAQSYEIVDGSDREAGAGGFVTDSDVDAENSSGIDSDSDCLSQDSDDSDDSDSDDSDF